MAINISKRKQMENSPIIYSAYLSALNHFDHER
jgi:hypothetical protein